MAVIAMFPPQVIELQRELLQHHPDIVQQLQDYDAKDPADKIGYLAGLLDIVVDGWYTPDEVVKLATICLERLREKRTILVLPDTVSYTQTVQ